LFSNFLKQILLAAGQRRIRIYAACITPAEIGDILGGFFSGTEKAAISKTMAEGQAGPDKKGRGFLSFGTRGDENRFMTAKRKQR
jgi:hypothetical protein